MPPPSLHSHYNCFNTTTGRSATIVSPQPADVCFPIEVLQSDNDFTCSGIPPVWMSCQLNPGSGTTSNPVPVVLSRGRNRIHPLFASTCLSGLHHWFTCVQLIPNPTAGVVSPAFKPVAHHHIVSFAAAQAVLKTPPEGRIREASLILSGSPIGISACHKAVSRLYDFKSHTALAMASVGFGTRFLSTVTDFI